VVALDQLLGVHTGVDLAGLTALAKAVSERANVPIPHSKPIVGEDVFTQKLDMHVRVAREAPWLHEPFEPGLVGQRRQIKLGKGSGKVSVRAKLEQLGIACDDDRLQALVTYVNRQSLAQKRAVSDEELLAALAADR
jgi:isopropylmalate/homocitrate/citramalate synthase